MTRETVSLVLYRGLLRLYPSRFRYRFESQMLADFEEMLSAEGVCRSWKRVLIDAWSSLPEQHTLNATWPRLRPPIGLLQEARFVLRSLAKSPLYLLVAVITMALGVGAVTAIFSLVRATILKPLPFASPESIVALWQWNFDTGSTNSIAPATFRDFELRSTAYSALAAYQDGWMTLTEEGAIPDDVRVGYVQTSFFDVLGVAPILGRNFDPEEGVRGNHHVVLLSSELWVDRFGAANDIVGQPVMLDREAYRVIGVLPRGVDLPRNVALWRPLALEEQRWTTQRGSHFLSGVARLREGVSVDVAREELRAIASNLALEYPAENERWGAELIPIEEELVADVKPSLVLLQVFVLLVLGIACANVAGLQLARAERRRVELAIRSALGAGFWRLTRLLVLEGVAVALLGGLLGIFVAWVVLLVMRPLTPMPLPEVSELLSDSWVVLFALGVALLVGLLFGLAPALSSSTRARLRSTRSRHRLRSWLVSVEVALSLVLLVAAGWFVESFYRLSHVDPGIASDRVLTARISIPNAIYSESHDRLQFFEELHERLEELPGVRSAALSSLLPITGSPGWWRNSFHRPEHPPATPADQVSAYLRWISPGYLETMGIPLLRGRSFERSDTVDQPKVLLVDEAFARDFFPGEDPIGKRIVVEYDDWDAEIVGIVGNTRQTSLREGFDPHMYLPYRQTFDSMYLGSMAVVLRTEGEPSALAEPIREAVRKLDPQLAVVRVETLESRVSSSLDNDRFRLTLLSAFAVVALALALIGLYGVIAFIVGERRQEVGVRMALGAKAKDVVVMVLRKGARLIGFGVVAGVLAALALGRLVTPFLFEVTTSDAGTLAVVSALLVATALVAVWIPARSASRVDPITVLRYE